VRREAAEAALAMFARGGNAADAAVAAGLMLAVVDGHNSGLGGGCFILARSGNGEVLAIDGREMAPAAAHAEMYLRDGRPQPRRSRTGALAAGVPGAVAAYHELSQRMGEGLWAEAAELAAEVAAAGHRVEPPQASRLRSVRRQIAPFPATRDIFLRPSGEPYRAGDLLVQTDLAGTLRALASDGPAAFYQGDFAERTARWMADHEGLITREDLSAYHTVDRAPTQSSFRGCEIIGFPPPSSGGVHVAQILSMLERFDLQRMASNDPASYYHVVAEAMRLAFADRAVFLGDPDFAEVPRGLLDAEYLRRRGQRIEVAKRMGEIGAGAPPRLRTDLFSREPRHTTHFSVADNDGNWVAITATVNTTLGSKVVVPGTGVVLNNQMDDFAIAPGVPNAFGLLGNEANAPGPGKRPLSSMSPTIALRDAVPVISCGAAGGPRIISATLQILLRLLACEMPLEEAIAAPRVHHQWRPDKLYLEDQIDETVARQLRALGHTTERLSAVATAQAITRDADGTLTAAGEPRLPGVAMSI
jgi:gamma-glutamyltranspeptidase/glutathione hydrolase